MRRRLTQEEFISKCEVVHNGRYDYTETVYEGTRSKVKIICPEHGIFEQNAKNHKDGQGCPKCYHIKLTSEDVMFRKNEFVYISIPKKLRSSDKLILKSKKDGFVYEQSIRQHLDGDNPINLVVEYLIPQLKQIHNDRYNYIIDKYSCNKREKAILIDKLTGDRFEYVLTRHLKGMRPNKVTLNLFLYKSKKIHGNRYDYSLIKEVNGNSDFVDIICKEHGVFNQNVSNHMNLKQGCPYCCVSAPIDVDIIIERFEKTHSGRYDYSLVKLDNKEYMVDIICEEHGVFTQNAHKHISGHGCPECSWISKGEEYIKEYLDEFGIKYIRQHGFDDCRYINKLSFDFYLPELNTCIEFDGEQHFKPNERFGGEEGFRLCLERDRCKNEWCVENDVKLIRIRYDQMSDIKDIIKNELELN